MITELVGGALGLLGRATRARRDPAREEEPDEAPDGYANSFGVPLGRVGVAQNDDTGARAGAILDSNMRHSADRTGRIPRGVYRGKTPAEAALAARREAENQNRNNVGGGDVGRIGSDRSDYPGGGTGAKFSVPINRASAGLDRLNETAKAAQERGAGRVAGDMRGVSFWKNNGDGTATTGRYGADNKAVTKTTDIVPRVRAGDQVNVAPGAAVPKPADADTHVVYEGTANGGLRVKGSTTFAPRGIAYALGKDGRTRTFA